MYTKVWVLWALITSSIVSLVMSTVNVNTLSFNVYILWASIDVYYIEVHTVSFES